MGRIDLLWDAWEDCLCKEELRAEFDRLKAENKAIEASRQAFIKILDETMLENEELQSWLDRISEPIKPHYKFSALSGGLPSNAIQSSIDRLCNYLRNLQEQEVASQKPSEKPNHVHSDDSSVFWEGKEEDCPICNPPKCEHKNRGPLALGGTQRCLDCGEWIVKSLTQCPECIWGQKRREFTAVEGAYCKYVVYERCPRCKGEGRIPC